MTCLVAAGLVDPEWNYPSMIHVHSDSRGKLGNRTGSDGLAKSLKYHADIQTNLRILVASLK